MALPAAPCAAAPPPPCLPSCSPMSTRVSRLFRLRSFKIKREGARHEHLIAMSAGSPHACLCLLGSR